MTFNTSLVAVCCSRASVRSRFRACNSLNSRTFSIAITAWSAKVLSSAICFSENGRTSSPPNQRSRRWGLPRVATASLRRFALPEFCDRLWRSGTRHVYLGCHDRQDMNCLPVENSSAQLTIPRVSGWLAGAPSRPVFCRTRDTPQTSP